MSYVLKKSKTVLFLTFVESFSCLENRSLKPLPLKCGSVAPLLLAFSVVDVKLGVDCGARIFFFLLNAFWILK